MLRSFLIIGIAFIFTFPVYSQEKIIRGKVVISTCDDVLSRVSIFYCDSLVSTSSKAFGKFKITVPDSAEFLVFSKSKFKDYVLEIPMKENANDIKVSLNPVFESKFQALKKNTIALAPIELVNKEISLMYERSITRRHSVGIYNNVYINSKTILYKTPVYNGYKMELFYRYYPFRNIKFGTYVQAKVMWGYFDVTGIPYYYSDNDGHVSEIEVSDQFYTGGFGACGGVAWYPANKLYISISVGLQFFPMNVPKTIEFENQTYNLGMYQGTFFLVAPIYVNPWSITGPGSRFEIKFLFGGIF